MCNSILLYFGFFCVGLIDFAVNFCCPYQCKWLPGGPSLKWPIMLCYVMLWNELVLGAVMSQMCRVGRRTLLTHSRLLLYVCCRFYVGCSVCSEWYHGSCVGVRSDNVQSLSSFVCPSCSANSSRTEMEELHCICRTPYDASKYASVLTVLDINVLVPGLSCHKAVVA